MTLRNKRSLGIDYSILASESDKLVVSPCSLEASCSILHLALDSPNLKFKQLSASPDFIPILHYCAVSVRRFSFDPSNDIKQLLEVAGKSEVAPLAEELFIIEIFVINGIKFTPEEYPQINAENYPNFEKDLETTIKKCSEQGYLQGAQLKPRGEVNPEKDLPDKLLVSTYKRSEIEFWTLVLEFHRFGVFKALIQELRTSKKIEFPTEFLLAQIRGSPEALQVFKEYMLESFEAFFSDNKWFPFLNETTELINFLITDILPKLKPVQINAIAELYVPLLKQFMYLVYRGNVEVEMFVNFVYVTEDVNFVNVLINEKYKDISIEFRQIFLSKFDALFNNKRWCKFTEKSQLLLKYIAVNLYPHVPMEKKKLITGLNERLLETLLNDSKIETIITFMYGLPVDFFLLQFEQNEDTAIAFRNSFSINFDSYIVDPRIRELIYSSDSLLDIVVTNVLPKSETKQTNLSLDFYTEYLTRKLNADERNAQPIADFVKDIFTTASVDFLKFSNLSPSLQFQLFQCVAQKINKDELNAHKNLYSDFFISFLKRPTLCLLLPEAIRQPFYLTILVPALSANTLDLTVLQTFNLVTMLSDDPYAEQERPPFFTFLVNNTDTLLPLIIQNTKLTESTWNFILANEKDLRSANYRNFIFLICISLLQESLSTNARLFQICVMNFSMDLFSTQVTTDTKTAIILQITKCFQRNMEEIIPDKTNLKTYYDSAQSLLELFSTDPSFVNAISLTFTEENKRFFSVLIGVFSKEKPFKDLISKPEIFMNFLDYGLFYYPSNIRNDITTNDRFEDLFAFFNKYSVLISQNDSIRYAFIMLFLSNDSKLDRFLNCVTSPLHRAVMFTEFSDPAKNLALQSLFTTYFERCPMETPVANIFNVYVTVTNLPFIKIKNHMPLINRVAEGFVSRDQMAFDNCFPQQRSTEIETALHALGSALGVKALVSFVGLFEGITPCDTNCYKEVTENALLRFTPLMEEETRKRIEDKENKSEQAKTEAKDQKDKKDNGVVIDSNSDEDNFIAYQKEHPRFRRFSQDPDRFPEFAQALLALCLIFYLSVISFSDKGNVPTITCALIGSVCALVSAFATQYFPSLGSPGFTIWFFVQIGLITVIFSLGFTVYGLTHMYEVNIPLIFLIVSYVGLTLYRLIYHVQGIPQDEYDDADLLIIH